MRHILQLLTAICQFVHTLYAPRWRMLKRTRQETRNGRQTPLNEPPNEGAVSECHRQTTMTAHDHNAPRSLIRRDPERGERAHQYGEAASHQKTPK